MINNIKPNGKIQKNRDNLKQNPTLIDFVSRYFVAGDINTGDIRNKCKLFPDGINNIVATNANKYHNINIIKPPPKINHNNCANTVQHRVTKLFTFVS